MLDLSALYRLTDVQPDALSVKVKAAHLWPVMNLFFSFRKRTQNKNIEHNENSQE